MEINKKFIKDNTIIIIETSLRNLREMDVITHSDLQSINELLRERMSARQMEDNIPAITVKKLDDEVTADFNLMDKKDLTGINMEEEDE